MATETATPTATAVAVVDLESALSGAALFIGCPLDMWDTVQAAQHTPFVYVQYNGNSTAPVDHELGTLAAFLATYALRDDGVYSESVYETVNPCVGVLHVVEGIREYVDGPRMYEADGVVRFNGNFESYSHAFCIESNHPPFIEAMRRAIADNVCFVMGAV